MMNAITRIERAQLNAPVVSFTLNGREVQGKTDELLIQVAEREGIEIPHLCYKGVNDIVENVGNCRACVVEINGERVLAPSCCRYPKAGMEVTTNSKRATKSQKMVLELLLSDTPENAYTRHSELDLWAGKMAVGKPRFDPRRATAADPSHPAI